MTKQPSPACLTPTPSGNWRRPAQRVQGQQTGIDATRSPWRGFTIIIGTGTDRTLKASPPGGLRPALTVLPSATATRPRSPPRARHPRSPPSRSSRKGQNGLRYAETLLDKTRYFRHADMRSAEPPMAPVVGRTFCAAQVRRQQRERLSLTTPTSPTMRSVRSASMGLALDAKPFRRWPQRSTGLESAHRLSAPVGCSAPRRRCLVEYTRRCASGKSSAARSP
jgi:hypothetical protein